MFSARRRAVEPSSGHFRLPTVIFETEQHMFPPRSRPTFTAAVFSCAVHICALGLSSALMLTGGEHLPTLPLKVTIFQPAVPLPTGEKEAHEVTAPEPVAPPPVAKPEPKTKKPLPPPVIRVKKPPPQVVPPPPEPTPQPAALALPAPGTVATDGDEHNNPAALTNDATNATARDGSGKQTAAAQHEAGRSGVPGGTSARPDYSVNPKPPYPMLARRLGEHGIVLLRVHVRADGSVAEAEVKESSGSALLDDAALRTVRNTWRFTPARLDGVPVESWVEVPIRFVLGDV